MHGIEATIDTADLLVHALETLLRDCLEEVVNLEPLMVESFDRMTALLPISVAQSRRRRSHASGARHLVSRLAERLGDQIARFLVVLDEEDAARLERLAHLG